MAQIHHTTLVPTKLELLSQWLPRQAWYVAGSGAPQLTRAGGYRLDDPAGEVGIEIMFVTDSAAGEVTYQVPMSYRAAPLPAAEAALIGTTDHGVLGKRWVYDGLHDPVVIAQLTALVHGKAEPQAQSESYTADRSVMAELMSSAEGATLEVPRVLDPVSTDRDENDPAVVGRVTAQWRLVNDETRRGVVALVRRS